MASRNKETQQKTCLLESLPSHLLTEILLRLPAKDLHSCRRVCHDLRTLISDQEFNQLYRSKSPLNFLARSIRKGPLTLHLYDPRHRDVGCDTLDNPHCTIKLQFHLDLFDTDFMFNNSCHGLLCLSQKEISKSLLVCNPVLGEFIILPQGGKPRYHIATVAIGFSSKSKEYKVIRVICTDVCSFLVEGIMEYNCPYEAEVYDLGGSGSWRSIGQAPSRTDFTRRSNTYVNGAVHWPGPPGHNSSCIIRAFDFDTEKFRVVPEPESSYDMEIGVLRGCLCVYCSSSSSVWLMKEYNINESWTKLFAFNDCGIPGSYAPFMVQSDGSLLMMAFYKGVMMCASGVGFLSCHRKLRDGSKYHSIGYHPSFVPLKHVVGRREKVKVCRARKESFGRKF